MAIIYDGSVCSHVIGCLSRRSGGCDQLFRPVMRLVKLVPVNIVFAENEFLNCSVWAVGTTKHLVLLVVSYKVNYLADLVNLIKHDNVKRMSGRNERILRFCYYHVITLKYCVGFPK